MYQLTGIDPIEYLAIGHISKDITPQGSMLGGTVAYAALTAQAMGMRVGIVTSFNEEMDLEQLSGIPIINSASEQTTTFENVYTKNGRLQKLHHTAEQLNNYQIPEIWRQAPIVHLAPIIQEIPIDMLQLFRNNYLCLTPQGWMRELNDDGIIHTRDWPEEDYALRQAEAVVVSNEDVEKDTERIAQMAASSRVLVVTKGSEGAEVYMHGEIHQVDAPSTIELDSTGAGDIFSAAFFITLRSTKNPVQAARFASQVAALSVKQQGLDGAPTKDDIFDLMHEVHQP